MIWPSVAILIVALDIAVPGAALTRSTQSPATSVRMPDTVWTDQSPAPQIEGAVRRSAYRVAGGTRTTLQLMDPVRAALVDDGYEVQFSCADIACGGFDFRFQLDILGEPDMHVDFGDFRYVLMTKDGGEPHTVSVVTSRSQSAGFIHVTEISDAVLEVETVTTPIQPNTEVPPEGIIEALLESGHAVLEDLEYQSGSAELGEATFQSLQDLSTWLSENPDARISVVGHTDAVGSLEANTVLSQRRAQSVVSRLVDILGANPAQLTAQGAGYLSPRDSNLTEEGRARNRRVEVILLSRE